MGRIKIDFANPAFIEIPVMQDDTYTRNLSFDMLCDGLPFTPSTIFGEGYGYRIDYVKRADGTKGRYEKLPDNSNAVTEDGSKITVHIAPQVLTKAGDVIMNIVIYKNADGKALRSFPVVLKVYEAAVRDDEPSQDYWNVKSLADVTAALEEVEETMESKRSFRMIDIDVPTSTAATILIPGTANVFPDEELRDGDAVIGTNGFVAVVFTPEGEEDKALRGTGNGVEMEKDVSAAYAAQSIYETPQAYLASLSDGRYKLTDSENSVCFATNVTFEGNLWSEIRQYTDDALCFTYLYKNGTLQEEVERGEFGTSFTTPVSVQTPEASGNVAPKGYVDEGLAGKLNINGTAKLAENLDSKVGVTETAPYNLRTTGGSLDVGGRVQLKKLVGMSLKWNQLISNGNFASATGWDPHSTTKGSVSVSNQELTYTFKSIASNYYENCVKQTNGTISIKKGHQYLSSYWIWVPVATLAKKTFKDANDGVPVSAGWTRLSGIISYTSGGNKTARWGVCLTGGHNADFSVGDTYKIANVMVLDLTEIFGKTIADRIATMEGATAGSGVAWVARYLPRIVKSYYATKSTSFQSVKAASRIAVGFNLLDGATGKAVLVGGLAHQITGTYTALSFTPFGGSATTVTPDSDGKFTPGADGELTVTGGGADTCVHLVWDGERDGEYKPHEAHTYALGGEQLRGIPELDANGNLTSYGDEKTPDGTITRKFAEVNLGTLTFNYNGTYKWFYANLGAAATATDAVARLRIIGYEERTLQSLQNDATIDKSAAIDTDGYLYIRDLAYTTAEAFTSAINGSVALYELATPTSESGTPYTEVQVCDNWGTEQLVDAGVAAGTRDMAIPVCHESVYLLDIKAKAETAPDVPANDGEYALDADGGAYTYKPLAQTQAVGGLLERCPDAPTEDGTYVLKSVVSSGVKIYSWVAET